ncbi:MAG: hypothetical protein D6813_11915 [Calditrichaeota bacterium]|nr:MAG: hypothetical protein D6813_11915 [Calditrichota bacterium]
MTLQAFQHLFKAPKVLIGMIHLLPLPGSPKYDGQKSKILEKALNDAQLLQDQGFHGMLIENFYDMPYFPNRVRAETIATMTWIGTKIKEKITIPVGINVLRNDAISALCIAEAIGADFIRVNVLTGVMVTDQGIIQGQAHKLLRLRKSLNSQVKIFADLLVKHAEPLVQVNVEILVSDMIERSLAEGLIITGERTGKEADYSLLKLVKDRLPDKPVLVGSGVNDENLHQILKLADGVIVGTWLKKEAKPEAPFDVKRVQKLVRIANSWR